MDKLDKSRLGYWILMMVGYFGFIVMAIKKIMSWWVLIPLTLMVLYCVHGEIKLSQLEIKSKKLKKQLDIRVRGI